MSLADNAFGPPHRVVEAAAWHDALAALHRDGYTFLDWLSAVDEHPDGLRLVAHVVAPGTEPLDHVLVATYLDRHAPQVSSVSDVWAGATWHERETQEMFGIDFGRDYEPLLLPDGFEGHPLRKEFVLAARVAKAWPGAKEPGESDADVAGAAPGRRRLRPPGVPDDWGHEQGGGEGRG